MGVDIQTYRAKIGTYRHSCGTDVATCVLVINFSQCLKYIGSVLFIGILLMMAGIEPNPGPNSFDLDLQSDEVTESSDAFAEANIIKPDAKPIDLQYKTTIEVSGLPANVNDEMLIMFFENKKRQGGGRVKTVLICERDGHAFVTFEKKKAVETVLKKKPITFHGLHVKVERYVPPKISSATLESSKLFVAGLPLNVKEEALKTFFENEIRQGDSEAVLNVTVDQENQTAVVELENPEAVSTVLEKRPFIISGQEVKVDIFEKSAPTERGMEQRKPKILSRVSSFLDRRHSNTKKVKKAENKTSSEEGKGQRSSKNGHRLLHYASKVTSLLDPRNSNMKKVKKAENKTSSEGGYGQRSSKSGLHTLCQQTKTKRQRIESEAPDSEGL